MWSNSGKRSARRPRAAWILVTPVAAAALWAWQPGQSIAADGQTAAAPPAVPARPGLGMPRAGWREQRLTMGRWGIDELRVRPVSSGSMIEFRYLVVDREKARPLNDKKIAPVLTVERTGVELRVPTMENVGALRQMPAPENGKEYFMIFQNQGRQAKSGDLVDLAIGPFHARGLRVE